MKPGRQYRAKSKFELYDLKCVLGNVSLFLAINSFQNTAYSNDSVCVCVKSFLRLDPVEKNP